MQNWVIHGSKAQDTSIKYIWWHLAAECYLSIKTHLVAFMVAGCYLSIKTHLVAFMAADCNLSIKTLIMLLVGNKFYQQVQ